MKVCVSDENGSDSPLSREDIVPCSVGENDVYVAAELSSPEKTLVL